MYQLRFTQDSKERGRLRLQMKIGLNQGFIFFSQLFKDQHNPQDNVEWLQKTFMIQLNPKINRQKEAWKLLSIILLHYILSKFTFKIHFHLGKKGF